MIIWLLYLFRTSAFDIPLSASEYRRFAEFSSAECLGELIIVFIIIIFHICKWCDNPK